MRATKNKYFWLAGITMAILLSSALSVPTLSAYADGDQKDRKDKDNHNHNHNEKCENGKYENKCKIETHTSLSSSDNPSTIGQSVTFTAKISPNTATGTVQFAIDGTNLGSPVTVSGGTAVSSSISTLAKGSHHVTANFVSDTPSYVNSNDDLTQHVRQIETDTTLTSSHDPSTVGQSVTFTAKISPHTATGTVQFSIDGTNLGSPVTVSGGTAVSSSISTLAKGSHHVTAHFISDTPSYSNSNDDLTQDVKKSK